MRLNLDAYDDEDVNVLNVHGDFEEEDEDEEDEDETEDRT